jgi:two-component system LytT family response regulator
VYGSYPVAGPGRCMTAFRAYVLDDEPLAVKRLCRILSEAGRFEVVGTATEPTAAVAYLSKHTVDVLFLDIQMPGMSGFELLAKLPKQPLVVFTTAFDQYALKAFEVNSIDYLLKPVEPDELKRVIDKLELRGAAGPSDFQTILEKLASTLERPQPKYLDRVACRAGSGIQIVSAARITHFFAEDKVTWAAANGKTHAVDHTIAELEQKLDPRRFIRIHRSTLLNLDWVDEVHPWFVRGLVVKLRDAAHTELTVSRDRVRALKERLGL